MKIAILSCFYPYRGGIAQFNANLLLELGKCHEVKAYNFTRQYPSILFPGKSQKVSLEDKAQAVESTAVLDTVNPITWHRAASAIRRWSPDVVIVRYWMSFFAPSLGTVLRGLECKRVAILDNVIPHEKRFFDKAFTKWFLGSVDGCVTLCNEVATDLLAICPTAHYTVIPHPIYSHFGPKVDRSEALKFLALDEVVPAEIATPAARNDRKIILFFGLIREYKGLDILLEAFNMLDETYHLVVAGEPYSGFEKYQEIINSCTNKENIHLFLDYIPDSEVKYFFSAADVVVLPYRSATQSGVSSIANFFEVPMIVTNVGGLKETIADRGIVSDEISPKAIAAHISRFFEEPGLKNSFVNKLQKDNQKLSWNNFCKELVSFIESV